MALRFRITELLKVTVCVALWAATFSSAYRLDALHNPTLAILHALAIFILPFVTVGILTGSISKGFVTALNVMYLLGIIIVAAAAANFFLGIWPE